MSWVRALILILLLAGTSCTISPQPEPSAQLREFGSSCFVSLRVETANKQRQVRISGKLTDVPAMAIRLRASNLAIDSKTTEQTLVAADGSFQIELVGQLNDRYTLVFVTNEGRQSDFVIQLQQADGAAGGADDGNAGNADVVQDALCPAEL